MNIFIIPTSYPHKGDPNRNPFIFEQAKGLAFNNDVTVLHVIKLPTKHFYKRIDKSIHFDDEYGINHYSLKLKTFFDRFFVKTNRNAFVKKMVILFERALSNQNKPDVIYAHFSCWAGYAACVIGKKHNIPVVTLEHGSIFNREKIHHSILDGLSFVVENSTKMYCVSQSLKLRIKGLTKTSKEIGIIPNLIDDSFRLIERIKQKNNAFTFCCLGRLFKIKRIDLLINAFCSSFKNDENVFLIIGGDGPEKKKLSRIVEKNKANERIKLYGSLNRTETLELYAKSDCFILLSESETFGIVYREAMATGIPIITTNHGGFDANEWDPRLGLMLECCDLETVSNAMKHIIKHYKDYDPLFISQKATNLYSREVVINKIEKELKEAIVERKEVFYE